jgi:hypothetical protein
LADRLWKNKVTIISASVVTALIVVVVALLAIQQQQIQLPEEQVSEQPESNLTIPQTNISSSNTSNTNNNNINNAIPLEQSELVMPDMMENTTNTIDESERQDNESEEDVMRGHLEEDILERQAQLNANIN